MADLGNIRPSDGSKLLRKIFSSAHQFYIAPANLQQTNKACVWYVLQIGVNIQSNKKVENQACSFLAGRILPICNGLPFFLSVSSSHLFHINKQVGTCPRKNIWVWIALASAADIILVTKRQFRFDTPHLRCSFMRHQVGNWLGSTMTLHAIPAFLQRLRSGFQITSTFRNQVRWLFGCQLQPLSWERLKPPLSKVTPLSAIPPDLLDMLFLLHAQNAFSRIVFILRSCQYCW